MPARKRGRVEIEDVVEEVKEETVPPLLQQIRKLPEFAALMQYFFFFGKAIKLAEIEVEVYLICSPGTQGCLC
jgi:hypothetical protein